MTGRNDLPPAAVARLADLLVAAVAGCPAVAGFAEAPGGQVATYLPGRIVSGVAVRPGQVEVCVTARYGLPLAQVAAQVRAAVTALVPDQTVDVVIGDMVMPDGPRDQAARP